MKKYLLLLLILLGFTTNAQVFPLNNYCGDTIFDLTAVSASILANQNPNDFAISFYESQSNAAANLNAIQNTTNYQSTASPQTLFVRVQNLSSGAITIVPFSLVVNATLSVTITGTLDAPISTLTATVVGGQEPYIYTWSHNGVVIVGQTSASITVTNALGEYTVTATDVNGCAGSQSLWSTNPQTIVANDDTVFLSNLGSGVTPGVGSILSNDYLNTSAATLNNVSISLLSASNDGIFINFDGQIAAYQNTPSGTYTLVYQICELANPNNCDSATVTINVDFCRANTPVIDSVVQPLCSDTNGGTVNLSGLPATGTWQITLSTATNTATYNDTGETFSIPNLGHGLYSLQVLAEDILQANCYESFPVVFTINQENGISLAMDGTYVDFNANGITDIGDVINYQFEVTNHSCVPVDDVAVTSTQLSISGDPISIQANESNNVNFTSAYVLTQENINSGLVTKHAAAFGFYNEFISTSTDSITIQLNIPNGIKLNAFIDANNNGVQDNAEQNFTAGSFTYQLNSATAHTVYSSYGIFYLYESNPLNSYYISYSLYTNNGCQFNYSLSTPSYSNITIAAGSGIVTYNFPIVTNTSCNDLVIHLNNYGVPPRPGFIYQNTILYKNQSNQTIASGTITFKKDNLLSITNVSETGTIATADGFAFDFTNLVPNEVRYIIVSLQVPTIPTVALGSFLTNSAHISLLPDELNELNNNDTLTQAIVGSYDPNDKAENHGGKIVYSSFTADDYLTYTIRFENTGNAEAINIRVDDVLDAKLDETSIQMVRASHPYVLDRVENALSWKFDGVNLPPSIPNDDVTGHGYIVFRVKPKTGFALGDIIPNTANIYFDFNPAIVTNTCTTEFVNNLANSSFAFNQLTSYPNPVKNLFHISNDMVMDSMTVTTVLGQTILTKNISASEANIDLSELSKGVYLVKIKAGHQEKTIKIIKE